MLQISVDSLREQETEELIHDVLKVEVFRHNIASEPLVGSFCVANNSGALVHPNTKPAEQAELASLLQVQLCSGTVNQGSSVIGAGLIANDWIAFCGIDTTAPEISTVESIFNLQDAQASDIVSKMRSALIDTV